MNKSSAAYLLLAVMVLGLLASIAMWPEAWIADKCSEPNPLAKWSGATAPGVVSYE